MEDVAIFQNLNSSPRLLSPAEPFPLPQLMAPRRESGLTLAEANELMRKYPEYGIRAPHATETPKTMKEGELCLHLDYFKCGLRLPIQEPILAFLKFYKMVPSMLTPNTFAVLLGLHRWFKTFGLKWSAENIMSLITIVPKGTGLYFAQVRCGLTFAMKGLPPYSHGWDRRYAFFSPKKGTWEIPTVVNDLDVSIFRKYSVSKEVGDIYTSYSQPFMCLDVKNNSISFVREVKKKSEGKKMNAAEVEDEVNVEEGTYETIPGELRKQPERAAKKLRLETIPEGLLMLEAPPPAGEIEVYAPESHGKAILAVPSSVGTPLGGATGDGLGSSTSQAAGESSTFPSQDDLQDVYITIDGTKDHYVDVEHQVLVSRLDNVKRFIPEMELSDVPAAMVTSLSHKLDYDMMKKMDDDALVQLQAQKAFGSCMVAQFIAEKSEARRVEANRQRMRADEALQIGHDLKVSNDQLKAQVEELTQEVDVAKKSITEIRVEEKRLTKRVADLEEIYDKEKILYDETVLNLKQELNAAKFSSLATKKREDEEKKTLYEQLELYKTRAELLRQERDAAVKAGQELTLKYESATTIPPPEVCAPSASQVIEEYKNSDAFTIEMRDVGDDAFRVLKLALIADGKVSKEDVEGYDLEKCFDRDAEGDFINFM